MAARTRSTIARFDPEPWILQSSHVVVSQLSRGIWFTALCWMHAGNPPDNELRASRAGFARLFHITEQEWLKFEDELIHSDFARLFRSSDLGNTRSLVSDDNPVQPRDILFLAKLENSDTAKARARMQRFRESGRGLPTRWIATRVRILQRDQYQCGYCDRRAITVDHVNPRSRGGSDEDSNLVACCRRCNNRKGARTPEQAEMALRPEIALLLANLQQAPVN